MNKDFDAYLLALERELAELKTDGLKSSSSLAVAEHTISITQQIVGYDVNYHNDSCASQSAAIIEIIPADGKSMLANISVKSGAGNLYNRMAAIMQRIKNGHIAYEFTIVQGSATDLATIQGGGTIPPFSLEFVITATSEFTLNLTYRQDH